MKGPSWFASHPLTAGVLCPESRARPRERRPLPGMVPARKSQQHTAPSGPSWVQGRRAVCGRGGAAQEKLPLRPGRGGLRSEACIHLGRQTGGRFAEEGGI